MPDHVHLLIQPWSKETGQLWTIGNILHSIKGFSAKQIPSVMPHIGKLWQDGHYETRIVNDRHFQATVEYIQQNPIAANLIESPETHPYFWENPSLQYEPPNRTQTINLQRLPK